MILILAMYMLFASTFTIQKMALELIDPILFIGIRMALAGCLLSLYLFFKKDTLTIPVADIKFFLYIIFFHIYIAYVFESIALQTVDAAKVCLFYNFTPFLTATISHFFLGERICKGQWFGLTVGFCGLLVLLFSYSPENLYLIYSLNISSGEFFMIISVCSSVIGWIIFKKLVAQKNYSPIFVNAIGMFGGGLLALVTSFLFEGHPIVNRPSELFLYTGLLILIANIIGYNLYGYLLKKHSPTLVSFAGFTTPLFAAIFGWIFLAESVSVYFFISLILVTIGLAIFYKYE